MRHDERNRRFAAFHREFENIGIDHDEVAPEEARRECIEDAAFLNDVDVGQRCELHALCDLGRKGMHGRKLPRRHAHAVAA